MARQVDLPLAPQRYNPDAMNEILVQVEQELSRPPDKLSIRLPSLVSVPESEATGAATATLGTNSPATAPTAPHTWMKFTASDGSTVYVPAWK
jgi:hypothetical protein